MVKVSSSVARESPFLRADTDVKPLLGGGGNADISSVKGRSRDGLSGFRSRESALRGAEDRPTDQFSLRLLDSGLYKLGITGTCNIQTSTRRSGGPGSVQIDFKGASLLHPHSLGVLVRSPTLFAEVSISRGALIRFYAEHCDESGIQIVVTACKSGWDCVVRDPSNGSYRCLANRFDVAASILGSDQTRQEWKLGPDLKWEPSKKMSLPVDGLPLSSFKGEIQCNGPQFRLAASIAIVDFRIQSAKFFVDWSGSRA